MAVSLSTRKKHAPRKRCTLLTSLPEDSIEENLRLWENTMTNYEVATSTKLGDLLRVSMLKDKTKGSLSGRLTKSAALHAKLARTPNSRATHKLDLLRPRRKGTRKNAGGSTGQDVAGTAPAYDTESQVRPRYLEEAMRVETGTSRRTDRETP